MITYYKIKNKIYNEQTIEENEYLTVFGPITNDSFLYRILNCYGLDLKYDLNNQQLIIKDIKNNEILNEEREGKYFGNDATLTISIDEYVLYLHINIKRKSGLDISLVLLIPTFVENLLIGRDKELLNISYSKYGQCSISNQKTQNTLNYDTINLHNYLDNLNLNANSDNNNLDISINDNNYQIIYNLDNDKLKTDTKFLKEDISNKKYAMYGIVDISNYYHYFDINSIELINDIMPIIVEDLETFSKLTNNSNTNNKILTKKYK